MAHEVDVKTFTISKYAATNAQFCKFLPLAGMTARRIGRTKDGGGDALLNDARRDIGKKI